MKCRKCKGRVFLDRVFSDNKNYELYCMLCGDRRFINKDSEFGVWVTNKESQRLSANVLSD